MKNIICFAAVAGILFCSCAKEGHVADNFPLENHETAFTAGFLQTKTNLAPGTDGSSRKMIWSGGDMIGVFDGKGIPRQFRTEQGGETAVFKGEASPPDNTWYAFYPYDANAVFDETKGLLTVIPEIQYAKKDGVSDNVTLLVAKTDVNDDKLYFRHACGLVEIELPEDCISATLEIADLSDLWNHSLSGGVSVKFDTQESWATNLCYPSVTLLAEDGGMIPAGKYYLAVKPVDYTGKVILSVRNAEGRVFIREIDGLDVGAGQIRPIGLEPVWIEDDGLSLYSEMGGDNHYNAPRGEGWNDSQPSFTTDENQLKVFGKEATRIEYTSQSAWSGRVALHQFNTVDLAEYIDNGYAVEYYVRMEPSLMDIDRELIFRNYFKTTQNPSGGWESHKDLYRINRRSDTAYIYGIQDNLWHRVSMPLTSEFLQGATGVYQLILDPDFQSEGDALAALGGVMYLDEFRIVRKKSTL